MEITMLTTILVALITAVIGPETVPRMDGKIQLESKDDMKSRGLPSPNKADAPALTFAYSVQKKHGLGSYQKSSKAASEWDPFAEPRT